MAILIDPPQWPAHGTVFSHLVSDVSLDELHAFAAALAIPVRAFDHDHYDVPIRWYSEVVARGAIEVSSSVLLRSLVASGLRLRTADRTPKRTQVLPWLRDQWRRLLPDHDDLGEELLERWSQLHRHYHDVRHLASCLRALDLLGHHGPVARAVRLAAWFHDAVYEARPGADEEASADLAVNLLARAGNPPTEIDEVIRLVLMTQHHVLEMGDVSAAQLSDADLSILGAPAGQYDMYVRNVRLEFEGLDDPTFRAGRMRVLATLLDRDPIFHTRSGRLTWEGPAQHNLRRELGRWTSSANA